jgi:hypothetical protein
VAPFAFLSYSSADIDFVRTLSKDLKSAGVGIWLADTDPNYSDIPPGKTWDSAVEKALTECHCLVVVLSPSAVESKNVKDEFGMILDRGKDVYPVVYRSCPIPLRLSRIQRLDLYGDYSQALQRLSVALVEALAPQPAPSAAPAPTPTATPETFSESELSDAGQAIAWESLRAKYWPEPVALDLAIEVIRGQDLNRRILRDPSLQGSEKMPQERARRLLERLVAVGFLRYRPGGNVEVVNPLNAVKSAAYLQVDRFGADRSFWDGLLSDARQKLQDGPGEDRRASIVNFLAAMRSMAKSRSDTLKIPHAVLDELDQLVDSKLQTDVYEYFTNFVRKWGAPVGIGKIQPSDVPRGTSVRLTRRNGRVTRLESVNGSGSLVPRVGSSLSYVGSDGATPEQTECRWEFSYDESGNVAWEEASDSAGRLLYRCSYSPAPPSAKSQGGQRETTARYYIDNSDTVHPRTRSGASFVRITRDDAGFDQRFEYLDGLGMRQPDQLGRFGQQAENGPLGLPVRLTCLSPDLNPAPCRKGYVFSSLTYDERGNIASQSYFDASNQAVSHGDGYHKATFSWDARDNWTEVRLYDVKGEPAIFAPDGFSGWKATYDDAGNQIGQTYLDRQGNPSPVQAGYAGWKGTCDVGGKLVDQTYLDALGNLTRNKSGIVRTIYQFDTAGNLLEFAYRDAAGNPAADSQGLARLTRRSDVRGQAIGESYFGLDGQPIRIKDGYAGFQATYDGKGNQTEFVFLGPDGVPDWGKAGYARQRLRFDPRGNVIEERFFSPSDQPAQDNDGVHQKVHSYDEHGNLVLTRRFDAAGEPAVVDGYSITTQSYDAVTGNAVRKEYRDANGRLTPNCDGYAVERLGYDACGRQIQGVYLDPEGNPILRPQGYAAWTAGYNARGLMVERCNRDVEGKPTHDRSGVTCWLAAYDARGNRTQITYVDPEGHPALSARGLASIVYTYDVRGNRTSETYLGLDGKAVALQTGAARIRWVYDPAGNAIEQIFLNAAGDRVVHPDGYASSKATYDARGNCIAREFLGAQSQFVANKDGFVRILTEFDDWNRPTRERKFALKKEDQPDEVYETLTSYDFSTGREEVFRSPRRQIVSRYNLFGHEVAQFWFQPDGSPELTRDADIAFSRWEASYGSCGRLKRKVYFDAKGAGVHRTEFAHDSAGNAVVTLVQMREDQHWRLEKTTLSPGGRTVQVSLLSKDSKTPVLDSAGRASWEARYDDQGNRIQAAYFDAAGAPVPYRGHLRTSATYDATSRLIKSVYLIPFGGSDTLQRSFVFAPDTLPELHFESPGADGKSQVNEAFVLEYRLKPGDVCHYATTITLGPGQEQKLRMLQRCTAVNPDGTFEVTMEVGDPAQSITMTMARSGRVLRTSLGEPFAQPWFPTHPIFVGEPWSQQMPFSLANPFTGQTSKVPLTYNYVLAELKQVDGRRVARIQVEIPTTLFGIAPEVTVTIEGNGETLFDIDQGAQLSSDVSSHVIYAVMNDVNETRMSVSTRWEP